ncbi:MAG: DUF1269 domain-containing protein [Acidimicrobiia bacterium]|nr:DUF1269 domain-containing protein [Acidimicrobiia bacterium]MDH5519401.1 DUF1269 domain-containing protein [Acidimicrobiia bacterium]
MATLTVWGFSDADSAERVRSKVIDLQKQELITIHDAVVVTWPADKKKPQTKQAVSTTGVGAAGGAFWGLLFGIIFFVPFFGMAMGAAMGALSGSMKDFGINDDFIDSVRSNVTPGTSALFLLSSDAVIDRVKTELAGEEMNLISTNLSIEDEEALAEMFSD